MKFCIKDFFSKCDQIRKILRIWSHFLKKSLMENFFFFFFFFFLQCKNERLIYRKKFNDITSRYDFIIFDFIIISAMKFTYTVRSQSKYIQNQVV